MNKTAVELRPGGSIRAEIWPYMACPRAPKRKPGITLNAIGPMGVLQLPMTKWKKFGTWWMTEPRLKYCLKRPFQGIISGYPVRVMPIAATGRDD